MKRILIIGVGIHKNFKDVGILTNLKKLPYEIFLAVPTNTQNWTEEFIDARHVLRLNFDDLTDCIAKIAVFCENSSPFDAILTFKEHFVYQTSVIAQAFNRIYTPLSSVFKASNNKLLFRNYYNQIGDDDIIKSDVKVVAGDADKLKISKPMVIKPLFGSSSCGVQLVTPDTDIKQVITQSKDNIAKKFNTASERAFLLESYIPGKAFSIDGIIQNKNIHFAGINEYIYGPLPYFVQIGNIIPANITKKQQDFCLKSMRKIIKYFGFDNMPFHAEVVLNGNGLYLIEIACRMPGGKISRGYELAYGFNFVEQVVNLYLGNPVKFKKTKRNQVIQKGKHLFYDCDILSLNVPTTAFDECDFAVVTNVGEHNFYPSQNKPIYFYTVIANSFKDASHKSENFEKTIDIRTSNNKGLSANIRVAREGASVAGDARKTIEAKTGKPVLTGRNAKNPKKITK